MHTDQLQTSITLHTFRFQAMNTTVEIAVRAEPEPAAKAKAYAAAWFRYSEQRFSRFREDSELSLLNRAAGKPFLVSETMLEVLELAQHFTGQTGGVFDPFVLTALQEAGYRDSFEQLRAAGQIVPSVPAASRKEMSGKQSFTIDRGMKAVTLPAEGRLDLGGIVKSWTVQRLAAFLRSRLGIGQGLINAGGDLITWGTRTTALDLWVITVENPWAAEGDVGTLQLHGRVTSAATSSILGRSWQTEHGPRHHLIDPVTMAPSQSDVVQCTVAGMQPTECEIWAKTICILGLHEGTALMAQKAPGYEALVFTQDGTMHLAADISSMNRRWIVPGAAVIQHEMAVQDR